MLDSAIDDELVRAMRDVARREIMPRFRNLSSGDVETKTGPEDLVTVADRAAEVALGAAIASILPDAAIVGEEAVSESPVILDRLRGDGMAVILDPIDGTANFVHGNATFGMILAVVSGGRTLLGILYDPVLDDWVIARSGGGTWFCRDGQAERRVTVRSPRPKEELSGYLPLYLFPAPARPSLAGLYPDFGRIGGLRCSCHEYRMIAMGQADFLVSHASLPWDHAAGQLAVTEAGGCAGRLDGAAHDTSDAGAELIAATGRGPRDEVARAVSGALSVVR